jgi:hypothetical protein
VLTSRGPSAKGGRAAPSPRARPASPRRASGSEAFGGRASTWGCRSGRRLGLPSCAGDASRASTVRRPPPRISFTGRPAVRDALPALSEGRPRVARRLRPRRG